MHRCRCPEVGTKICRECPNNYGHPLQSYSVAWGGTSIFPRPGTDTGSLVNLPKFSKNTKEE